MKIHNAKTFPEIFYGLHFCEGVAEYREAGKNPYRILIKEEAIRNMNGSFAGKPVYVQHVDVVNLEEIQEEADGYVIESFYNKADGRTWAKFIVVSDRGKEAIRNGWKLSNAYMPQVQVGGGEWHGVPYQNEVKKAAFEHLAIVPNPRYAESIILTPEEFKTYNQEKELELQKIANSKTEGASMLNFFKKTKVENTLDLESTVVVLPKTKLEKTIAQLVNESDEYLHVKKDAKDCYAHNDNKVKVGDEEMTVNELASKYMEMKKASKGDQQEKPEGEKNEDETSPMESDVDASLKDEKEGDQQEKPEGEKNEGQQEEPEGEKNEDEKEKEKPAAKKNSKEKEQPKKPEPKAEGTKPQGFYERLKNAPQHAVKNSTVIELSQNQLERGKSRYGSAS